MPNILLAAHGSLAISLKETAELIIGSIDGVECFEMTAGLAYGDAQQSLTDLVNRGRSRPEPLTVLVDIQGGSPFNICSQLLLEHGDFTLLTGINLPMLLEAATNPSIDGAALTTTGSAAVVHVNALMQDAADLQSLASAHETEQKDD